VPPGLAPQSHVHGDCASPDVFEESLLAQCWSGAESSKLVHEGVPNFKQKKAPSASCGSGLFGSSCLELVEPRSMLCLVTPDLLPHLV
jgi:hypothetical protein